MPQRMQVKVTLLTKSDNGESIHIKRPDMDFSVLVNDVGEISHKAVEEFNRKYGPELRARTANANDRKTASLIASPLRALPYKVPMRPRLETPKALPQQPRK
jgi:hypothetical protein